MAVPTITQISPSEGHAGGRTVVKITGADFAIPPDPPDNTHWAQTIQVLFNGVASEQVLPYGSDLIVCQAPPFLGNFPIREPIVRRIEVDVTVNNLDPDTGEVVSGETVTQSKGWAYTRPSADTDEYEAIQWLTQRVGEHLARQTIDNVVAVAAHPDYDPNQGTYRIEIEATPALVLTPRVQRIQFLSTEQSEVGTATSASVTDTTTYPVTAGTGVLKVRVDREDLPSQSITFDGTETTAAEIVDTINDQITGATASVDSGQVVIESDTDGALSFVQITANPSANPLLTFPTSEVQGDPEEEHKLIGGTWTDVYFEVRGISQKVGELTNLASMVSDFVHRSGSIPVPETVGDADSDLVWFAVASISDPIFPEVPENSTLIKEFLATFVLKDVVLGGGTIAAATEDFHSYVGSPDVDLDLAKITG